MEPLLRSAHQLSPDRHRAGLAELGPDPGQGRAGRVQAGGACGGAALRLRRQLGRSGAGRG
eukprot:8082542-Lingulodinium_polyedra.AAC.1